MIDTPLNMLVADDSPLIHQVFRDAVASSRLPIQITECSNGRDCMAALGRPDMHLAFIDVFMPEMSGTEALTHARLKGNKTFVTLMSARPNERCIELARELSAYEFLTKPFGPAEIASIIRSYERVCAATRALIVDDSMTVRRVIRRVLERSVFRLMIDEAANGEAAVALCTAKAFHLVFLDCNMPGLNGLDTLDQLLDRDSDIKVVMISGERNENRERLALKRGAAAVMHKPFYPSDIDAVLHRLLGLPSPTLTIRRPGVLKHFDVAITGRTIAVMHKETNHRYEYLWFREPPHLRSTHVRPNQDAIRQAGAFRSEAARAAMVELKSARLLG